MRNSNNIMLGLLAFVGVALIAIGVTSIATQGSKPEKTVYSAETKNVFMKSCMRMESEQVCGCALGRLQQKYGESEYLKYEADYQKNRESPEYNSFLKSALDECYSKFANGKNNAGKRAGGICDSERCINGDGSVVDRNVDKGAEGVRTSGDIMAVVHLRLKELRLVYNEHLKKRKFQGRVVLKFTIAPDGKVISISIESSTTGYDKFDEQIKDAVASWEFNKVTSGNTTVTIPFTFSE